MSNSPLTPPTAMADLDHQLDHQLLQQQQQQQRYGSSLSPVQSSESIAGLAQSALPAVSSPTTDKHPKGKRKRTAYVYILLYLNTVQLEGCKSCFLLDLGANWPQKQIVRWANMFVCLLRLAPRTR